MPSLWQDEFVQLCGIDESREKNVGCEPLCINTRESYYCQCRPGYRLVRKFNYEDNCTFALMVTIRKKLNDSVASLNDDTARRYATVGTIPCCTISYHRVTRNEETMCGNAVSVYAPLESVGGGGVSVWCWWWWWWRLLLVVCLLVLHCEY
ncbi:hypothetical protein E2C01_066395 [Portunus trituberculatus]|uniref:EGF-like calcium-binding domain-containing protein n=1 Tax=Portunus trituberculatus TaxID=210409 RepID=A0A5B7HLD9_PORTR|nr:hypothetical protein [Portunus trituberculatus]